MPPHYVIIYSLSFRNHPFYSIFLLCGPSADVTHPLASSSVAVNANSAVTMNHQAQLSMIPQMLRTIALKVLCKIWSIQPSTMKLLTKQKRLQLPWVPQLCPTSNVLVAQWLVLKSHLQVCSISLGWTTGWIFIRRGLSGTWMQMQQLVSWHFLSRRGSRFQVCQIHCLAWLDVISDF